MNVTAMRVMKYKPETKNSWIASNPKPSASAPGIATTVIAAEGEKPPKEGFVKS